MLSAVKALNQEVDRNGIGTFSMTKLVESDETACAPHYSVSEVTGTFTL